MAAKAVGTGEPRLKVHGEEQAFFCAINHGKTDAVQFYKDPLERYTVMFYGFVSASDLLEAELRSQGVKPEKELLPLILQAYKICTGDFVDLLHGNFSLLISDSLTQSVFLAKDHFGTCPLYYTEPMRKGVRFFSSNISIIAEHPDFEKEFNPEPLLFYLSLEYNPHSESFWRNVYSVPAGSWVLITEEDIKIDRYFTPSFAPDERSLSEHVDEIFESVKESVHNYSNVESLGAYLSAGVDSSFVTVLGQPSEAFSLGFLGFDGIFQENSRASELAAQHDLNFHSVEVSGADYVSSLLKVQSYLDQPNCNFSTISLDLLGEFVDERVSYILTGDGADEFFGGYDPYIKSKRYRTYEKYLPKSLRSFIASRISTDVKLYSRSANIKRCGMEVPEYFFGSSMTGHPEQVGKVLKPEYLPSVGVEEFFAPFYREIADEDELSQKMLFDINFTLWGNMSIKEERMANAHNLQLRTPLLNRSIFDVACRIPAKMRTSAVESKVPFRRAASRVLGRKWSEQKKLGFGAPFRYYLKDRSLAQDLYDILKDPLTERFFQREIIDLYLTEHLQGSRARHKELYAVISFILWYKDKFID